MNNIKTLKLTLFIMSCIVMSHSNAQFNPFPFNQGGYTILPVQTIGIGDFPLINDVQSHLHVNSMLCATSLYGVDNGKLFRTDGNSSFDCQWEMWSGPTATTTVLNGRIFVPANTYNFEMECSNYITNAGNPSGGNIYFNTPKVGGGTIRRMQINGPLPTHTQQGQTYNRTGYVGLNVAPATQNMPASLLTLDGDLITNGDGYRPWMKIGAYIGNNTDNMYVGLLDNLNAAGRIIGNRTDAVIAWGNDSDNSNAAGPDVLRFIFTNYDTTTTAYVWGSEAGRWQPNGSFGVGDFRISQCPVHDRIEDYTWLPKNLSYQKWLQLQDSTGQFRLTWKSKVAGMLGTHADFQVDSLGDLFINPQDDSTPRFAGVGIRILNANTGLPQTPENTFEIMSGWHSPWYNSGYGSSGLKFRNLTSLNIPMINRWRGVLALDSVGNVIYVKDTLSPPANIGTCNSPSTFPAPSGPPNDGAIDLNPNVTQQHDFYFLGNGATSAYTNVNIGRPCAFTGAKLDVLQASGSDNTIGIFVENTDPTLGSAPYCVGCIPQPTIGIKSFLPAPPTCGQGYNVAGWFRANAPCIQDPQYAIFVPYNGGNVGLGFQFSTYYNQPSFYLQVNSNALVAGVVVPSDSILKKNISPFKYGLKAIRNLNPISYKYNGIGGFDTSSYHIGLIAQNLAKVVPKAVIQTLIMKDSITRDTNTILDIYEEGVLYTTVNAIKQLDSTVTAKNLTIDSLRNGLNKLTASHDSLRTLLLSYISCLNTLCGKGPNRSHSRSIDTVDNIQNVTLSNANTPVLYQNSPNPFSNGTKIRYYLPEGITGASMVFYDNYGNQIKSVQLSETGNGNLNITPDNLTAGIYSYSLIVNGKVIDTKRMLLQK